MKEAITLVLSVWTYCWGHRPHLLDLLSDLFAISEKQKMRHIYFVKLAATRTAKFPGKISVFLRFFCFSKEPQMSESFLQMVSTFLDPLLEEEEPFVHLKGFDWSSQCLITFALHISCVHNVARTLWHETKCRKFLNVKIKGYFAEKSSAEKGQNVKDILD